MYTYSVDIDFTSESLALQSLPNETQNYKNTTDVSSSSFSALDDSFMENFQRMQESLDRIQDFGQSVFSIPDNKKEEGSRQTFNDGNLEPSPTSSHPEVSSGEIIRGKRLSFAIDLLERNSIIDVKTQSGTYLTSSISWENDTFENNKISLKTLENMFWNSKGQATFDWITDVQKMGFLFSRDLNMDPFDKILMIVDSGDLAVLMNPGAKLPDKGQQSVYGMGLMGPDVGEVVLGNINSEKSRINLTSGGLKVMMSFCSFLSILWVLVLSRI